MPDVALSELDEPDLHTPQACRMLGLSKKSLYRLGVAGEIDSYLMRGSRRWLRSSLRAYKQRQIAKGPQFSVPPVVRKRGRPRKPRPEQEPSSAAAE